jgi:ubiquinone/menaquinone biosynthesis C-methylase UbiE
MNPKDDRPYWDALSGDYDRHARRSSAMYDNLIERIRMEIPPQATILDVGTGTGEIPLRISGDAARIEAVDGSSEMIRRARDKAVGQGIRNVAFRVQDASHLEYVSGQFDVVILANLLHVVARPDEVLAEASRVLRGGGKLIAPTFVHGQSLKTQLISWILRRKGHPVYTRFHSKGLKTFLEDHGFLVIRQVLLRNIMPVSFVVARRRP